MRDGNIVSFFSRPGPVSLAIAVLPPHRLSIERVHTDIPLLRGRRVFFTPRPGFILVASDLPEDSAFVFSAHVRSASSGVGGRI